jgi:hypothetical protein
MVRFKHEAPQTKTHTVDLGVHGNEPITIVGTRGYTMYQPFLVIEAKRLPAPDTSRRREYLIGEDKRTGGVQRFRLGLHGADVETAVIVGYVEEESFQYWHREINDWIIDLASTTSSGGCVWTNADMLGQLVDDDTNGTSSSGSTHQRAAGCCSTSIRLCHLWVMMPRKSVVQKL